MRLDPTVAEGEGECRKGVSALRASILELSFSTAEIRDVCELRARAAERLGREAAIELEQRLADAEAVECAGELCALFPDAITERSGDRRSLRLSTGHEIVFGSGHLKTPITSQGATNWAKVTRIRIVAIEGRHG